MKFVDQATVMVRAGDGGAGRISFRHEKFVDRGGPDGGDGGDGGSVIFEASRNHNTLVSFRYQKELVAGSGEAGGSQKKHGKRGLDMIVKVPVGTVISDDGVAVADLTVDGQQAVVAAGGRGGFGNAHFISSTRQAPKFAEPGGEGEAKSLQLELKLIADVGLVGLPNAGKSTFLSVVSRAKPKIADYPFTTLTPNLGMAEITKQSGLLIADIPGLIEGASLGKGLGDEFLRHIERTAVLLHLVDATDENFLENYQVIQKELADYQIDLSKKPQLVALTKADLVDPEHLAEIKQELQKKLPKKSEVFVISSQAHQGTKELLFALKELVDAARTAELAANSEVVAEPDIPVLKLDSPEEKFTVEVSESGFLLDGGVVNKFAERTDFENEESVMRYKSILQKHGIIHELLRRGAKAGDTIVTEFGEFEL